MEGEKGLPLVHPMGAPWSPQVQAEVISPGYSETLGNLGVPTEGLQLAGGLVPKRSWAPGPPAVGRW